MIRFCQLFTTPMTRTEKGLMLYMIRFCQLFTTQIQYDADGNRCI